MSRSIQIYLPPEDADFLKSGLNFLADAVILDSEAGQRGMKVSRMIQMIGYAYIKDIDKVTKLVKAIKEVAINPPEWSKDATE